LETKITQRHQILKAKFHSKLESNPLIDVNNLSDREIAKISGAASLADKFRDPKFREWFLDQGHLKAVLQSGAEASIQRLIDIVMEEDVGKDKRVTSATQVTAAKILLDANGLGSRKDVEEKFRDRDVNNMTEAELIDYIEKRTKKKPTLVK